MNWLQRLLYPTPTSCPTCEILKTLVNNLQAEIQELKNVECRTCDTLKIQLGIEQSEKRKLLEHIINPPKPDVPAVDMTPQLPIKPKHVPWTMRQQKLEADSRAEAQRLRAEQDAKANEILTDKQKEIHDLETDVGLKEATHAGGTQ